MRRKSERTVKSSPTKKTENTPRRTSRRTRKTPEKSINDDESENNSSDQASSSENETEEVVAPKRSKRTSRTIEKSSSTEELKPTTTRTRRKAANKKEVDTIEEDPTESEQATTTTAEAEAEVESKDEVVVNDLVEIPESTSVDSSTEPVVANEEQSNSNHEQNAETVEKMEVETPQADSNEPEKVIVENEENVQPAETTAPEVEVQKEEPKEEPKVEPKEEPKEKPSRRRTLRRLEKEPSPVETVSTVNETESTENVSEEVNNHESSELVGKPSDDAETKKHSDEGKSEEKDESPQQSEAGDEPKENGESKLNAKVTKKQPIVRKRKWLSNKTAAPKVQEITISTDSLKGIISDVKPVPLSDVKLDSSPEHDHESDDVKVVSSTSLDYNRHSEDRVSESADDGNAISISTTRKISIVNESEEQPLSPAKHNPCNILYITNLVRPFTVLQLKSLLQRTGKIVENGFWMDKIKSKCFVKYETEDEAVETRHALHGIRWPSSNPKCLNVDFGTENLMEKAIASTAGDAKPFQSNRDDRIVSSNDLHESNRERNAAERPVREWDLGKKSDPRRSRERDRPEKDSEAGKALRSSRERERERERERDRDRDRERNDRRRRSASASPGRKFVKKDNEPPLRLLDDLFRKTKTTPCIYWLPLTPEQIAVREEERQKTIQRRLALKKEREREEEEERQKRREREKRRQDSRERDRERRDRERPRDTRDTRDTRDNRDDRDRDRDRDRRRY